MMSTYEIYTTGGGYYVYDMMNFLAMFTSGNMFQDMLYVGIILGVSFAAIRMVLFGNLQGTAQYIILVAVIGAIGVGPKAKVIVKDSTYPLEIYGAVDNVPLSVAFVAHFTTSASYHVTRRMEALLSTPDNLTYQRHGMLFGATLMSQASRWRAVTPTFANNLVNFMENCMVDGTNIGLVNLDQLTSAGDLASYIGSTAPGALAYFDEGSGSTVRCSDGWMGLENQLNQEVQKVLRVKAAARAPKGISGVAAVDVNALTGTLQDFQNLMGMAGYDATRYLKQAMLIRALDDAGARLVANSGNSAAMSVYQAARADLQTQSSYQAVGLNATKWVPLIKIAFETLYYGAFPLALMLMMTPLALTVVKGYFSGFLWLAAWEPLSAILHTTMIKASTGYYREHTTTISGASTQDVLSWANHFGIRAVEQEIGTTAGYLMMSIPFLSFAIFFGATRMAGLATSMLNVSQGAAIDTGREGATGNIQSGNISMNNMAANKWNTSAVRDEGRYSQTLADGSVATTNADGSQTFAAGTAQSNVGLAGTAGQAIRSEISERLARAEREVETRSADYTDSVSAASAQLSDFARTASQSRTAGGGVSMQWSDEDRQSYQRAWRNVESFAEQHNLSTDVALSAMLAGSAAAKAGTPAGSIAPMAASLGADLQASGRLSASDQQSFQRAVTAAYSEDYSSTISNVASAAERSFSDSASSQGMSGAETLRSSLDQVSANTTRLTDAYERSQSLEHASGLVMTRDAAMQSKITDAFISTLQQEGYSADQISALVNPKTSAGIQRQQEVVGRYLPQILNDIGFGGSPVGDGPSYSSSSRRPAPSFEPLDRQVAAARLSTPDVGRYHAADEHARGLHDANSNPGGAGTRGASVRGGHDDQRDEVQRGLDQTTGGAALGRAGDMATGAAGWFADQLGLSPSNDAPTPSGAPAAPQSGMPSSFAMGGLPALASSNGPLELEIMPLMAPPRGPMAGPGGGYVDSNGFYQAGNIRYGFHENTVRDEPVRAEHMARLSSIVRSMGSEYGIVVTSGGQPAHGADRTGSHRHDHGDAVDFYLTQGGQRINPDDNKQLYAELIERAAPFFSGIGHYSWGVHMGGGSQAFWGPDTTSATADPFFKSAFDRGRT